MDIPRAIEEAVRVVAGGALGYATALAAVGVLSMALIQTAKDLVPIRRWFQLARVRAWLRRQAAQAPPPAGAAVDPDRAEEDLIRLATSGDRAALFDLPIEQVTGQMNAAAQIVLDFPWEHEHLFRCLAAQAPAVDLAALLGARPPAEGPRPPLSAEARSAQIDARNRVTHQVQRGLDGLQISAGFRWKLYLRGASIAVSAVIVGLGLALLAEEPPELFLLHLPLYVVTAIVGGFVAPVARDLVAALEGLRKR